MSQLWERIKKLSQFQLKMLEFRYTTWKNGREISKAYGTAPLRKKFHLRRHGPKAIKIGVTVLSCAVALFLGWHAIVFISSNMPDFSALAQQAVAFRDSEEEPDIVEATLLTSLTPESGTEALDTVVPEPTPVKIPEVHFEPETQRRAGSLFPDSLIVPEPVPYYLILADKENKTLHLINQRTGRWEIVRTFEVTIGEQEGRKLVSGDKKTPEGNYFIIGRKERSELASLYGPLAFILDYPNQEDRAAGRTGHGIWIHGRDRNSGPQPTQGCIALSNTDLLELAAYLGQGIATPVVILSSLDGRAPVESLNYRALHEKRKGVLATHLAQQAVFEKLVGDWKEAWENKRVDEYMDFYSVKTFRSDGLRWNGWKDRKVRTFNMYSRIEITVSNIILTDFSESLAVVKFIQLYSTNLNKMENGKRLTFTRENGDWKISGESTFPKEELVL